MSPKYKKSQEINKAASILFTSFFLPNINNQPAPPNTLASIKDKEKGEGEKESILRIYPSFSNKAEVNLFASFHHPHQPQICTARLMPIMKEMK